jgi:hypothetical protein
LVLASARSPPPAPLSNTFDDPDRVTLSKLVVRASGDGARVTVPARSVVALELDVA